jgi:hypothetical protein
MRHVHRVESSAESIWLLALGTQNMFALIHKFGGDILQGFQKHEMVTMVALASAVIASSVVL